MNKTLIFALALVSTVSFEAAGQTYQWKDSSGKTVISDRPPPGTVRDSRAIGTRQPKAIIGNAEDKAVATGEKPSAEKAPAADKAPQTFAEKEAAFQKRQQEAREKAEREAKEAAFARDRQASCEAARRNLTALSSGQTITQFNERGERVILDAAQRQQEIERSRRIMQDACSSK